MLTNKFTQFSADLLNTVSAVLGEADKHPTACECKKCKTENELEEGHSSDDTPPFDAPYTKVGKRKDQYGNEIKNVAKHLAKMSMNKKIASIAKEEVDLDEMDASNFSQQMRMGAGRASKKISKGYMAKLTKDAEEYKKNMKKEEAEEILDELSKNTLGRYVNRAADRMSTQGVTAGLKIAADEKSNKNFDTIAKRQKGISTAVSKLTKEEQDFIDSLNNDLFNEADFAEHNKCGTPECCGECNTIDEARGRPRKAGAKDFTVHPNTKEKLMHNNPEHMKKIEILQKNGVLETPKVEAGQHIMTQLSKAKTSMLGGTTINFTHGDSKHVSGNHAAQLLSKYAGLRPSEKESFQKYIGHSHENLMKHV